MKTKDIKSIRLSARQWFDGFNTYFTCKIFVNGKLITKLPMQYGYGDSFEYASIKWLNENFFSKQLAKKIGNDCFWRACQDVIKCNHESSKTDSLKRDL